MARNLGAPAHWLDWLKACAKDEWSSKRLRLPGHFAMLTGQDVRVLGAIASCWQVYFGGDDDARRGALMAVRALLPALQEKCHGFARELIAQQGDWSDRERVWARVTEIIDGEFDEVAS